MSGLYFVWLLFEVVNAVGSKAINRDILCLRLKSLEKVVTGPIQKQPDAFSLLYHSFPTVCHLIPPRETRVLMFPSHNEDNLTFYCPFRYSSSINVVMSPVSKVSWSLQAFETGFQLGLSIRTVFVLLQPNQHLQSPLTRKFQFNLPALKFTLYFYKEMKVAAEIECNKYCFDKKITVATLQENLHTPTLLLHKKLFRIGLANVIDAKVYGGLTHMQFVSGSGSYCNEWMRSGSLKLRFCSPDIFAVQEISRVHNLSIRSFSRDEEFEEMIPNVYLAQVLHGSYSSTNFSEDLNQAYNLGLVFSQFDSFSFIYCVLKQGDDETKDFKFWTQPFKTELWLVLVLVMTLYSIYSQVGLRDNEIFALEVCKSAFKFVEVMIGNGEIRRSRFQLCFAFLGFFICSFYSNCLLGYVLKEPPPLPYTGIKEILNDGFKIVDFIQREHNVSGFLAPILELRGIQVPHVFQFYNELHPSWEFVAFRLTEREIEAGETSNAQQELQIFNDILKRKVRFKYDWRVLPEVIGNVPLFWIVYTLNRDWIRITIDRIIESGLQTMWTTWENRAYMLSRGLKGKVGITVEDLIGSRRIELLMGIVGGVGITLSLLWFITEKLHLMVSN